MKEMVIGCRLHSRDGAKTLPLACGPIMGGKTKTKTSHPKPVILHNVFVHFVPQKWPSCIIYSKPSLPSQVTIDQSHDLITSLCFAARRVSIFPQCVAAALLWPAGVFVTSCTPHPKPHISFPSLAVSFKPLCTWVAFEVSSIWRDPVFTLKWRFFYFFIPVL